MFSAIFRTWFESTFPLPKNDLRARVGEYSKKPIFF
jgi:hypothetical protein